MPAIGGNRECERPSCTDDGDKRYKGPEGNSLRLCPSCYYRLVTRGASLSDPLGLGTDATITGNSLSIEDRQNLTLEQLEEYDTGPTVDDLIDVSGGTGAEDAIKDCDRRTM